MNNRRAEVYRVLLTPVIFSSNNYNKKVTYPDYEPEQPHIFREGNVIKSTQSYYPKYRGKNGEEDVRFQFCPDEDMSDFACGFYEIIYRDMLSEHKIVDVCGNFMNREFAGDTMTSIYKEKNNYHCLANFWMIPMDIGRTSQNTAKEKMKWSKTSKAFCTEDFMDRFLLQLKYNFEVYRRLYPEYFDRMKIQSFMDFVDKHFLKGSYVDDNYNVIQYSHAPIAVATIRKLWERRAHQIAASKYCDALWEYFFINNLIEHKEEYVDSLGEETVKDKYENVYICPKCGRTIKNYQGYSVPEMCDECYQSE